MEETEELQFENTTSYTQPSETLNNDQILVVIWMLICVIPNALLIYIFVKKRLYTTNFYFILMNWCISNILYILCLFYFNIVPEKYVSYTLFDKLYYINIILPTLTVILATLFMFRTFLHSNKYCTYFVYGYWCSFAACTIFEIIYSELGYRFFIELFYIKAPIEILCVTALFAKIGIFIFAPLDHEDENEGLRIIIAGVYITLNFTLWLLHVLIITRLFVEKFFVFILYGSYVDGFVKIVLLIYFDPSVRCYFYGLFQSISRRKDNIEEYELSTKTRV